MTPDISDSMLEKCFPNQTFKPMPVEDNVYCSEPNQYDLDITQFNNLPYPFTRNFTDPTHYDCFKTNETHHSIQKNKNICRTPDYNKDLSSDTIASQYLPNRKISENNINLNNISFGDTLNNSVGMETVSNSTRRIVNIIDKVNHSKRIYDTNRLEEMLNEPPIKKLRHISTIIEDNSCSTSTISQIGMAKNIVYIRNQPESNYTFSPTHDSEGNLIIWTILEKNISQQTNNNTDSNPSHIKPVNSDSNIPIPSIKEYEGTENGKVPLKKILNDSYSYTFILNGTSFSWNFDQKERYKLFLDLSGTSIRATNSIFAESVFNEFPKGIKWRGYAYFIPIFHTADFISLNNIDYFKISVTTDKHKINQILYIFIYQSIPKDNQELRLECPRICDFKQTINNLLETTFPIYSFPVLQKLKIIQFDSMNYDSIKREMTLNEYIKDLTQNPIKIKIKHTEEYELGSNSRIDEMSSNNKRRCWNPGLKIVYDIYKTFHTNITQILIIIDDDAKPLESKKKEINDLLNQIIQKIHKKNIISYPRKMSTGFKREEELMSFYAFCVNELRNLFEWWNKYLFAAEEVEYIEPFLQSHSI